MCLACEEAEFYYRWQLLQQIAKGEMPAGVTEDDLRAMEMPLPGEVELVEQPDGTILVKRVTKPAAPAKPAKVEAFACDSPDGE